MSGNTREAGRSTASRLLSLLAAFTRGTPSLTLSGLARASGLPLATASRLAAELVEWGALARRHDGSYQVGLRLRRIGALAAGRQDLVTVALPFMADLHTATGGDVELAVLDGAEVLVLETVPQRPAGEPRGRLPAHCTAVGKAMLAHQGAEARAAVGRVRCTPFSIVLPELLADALARVRRDGVGYAVNETVVGASSVAAPVLGTGGRAVAAVGIVVAVRADVRALAAAVRTAAAGIARGLADEQALPGPPG